MRRYIDECNTLGFNTIIKKIDEYCTSDYILHHPGSPDIQRGTASFDEYLQNVVKDMP